MRSGRGSSDWPGGGGAAGCYWDGGHFPIYRSVPKVCKVCGKTKDFNERLNPHTHDDVMRNTHPVCKDCLDGFSRFVNDVRNGKYLLSLDEGRREDMLKSAAAVFHVTLEDERRLAERQMALARDATAIRTEVFRNRVIIKFYKGIDTSAISEYLSGVDK